MTWQDYSSSETFDVCRQLKSSEEEGLSLKESAGRLEQEGYNIMSSSRTSAWQIMLRQLKSAFIYLLLLAALLSLILQNWAEALMIFAFIIINTVLGFFQEYRSERTVKMLSSLIEWRSKVIRGGKEMVIATKDLVVGDIILLSTGDKISADARILTVQNFSVDESALTGESVAVTKQSEPLPVNLKGAHMGLNMLFAGTAVMSGRAKAIVVATANKTEFGKIANLVANTKKISNFEVNISKFSSFILKLTIVTLAFVVLLNFIIKGASLEWPQLIIFAIALAIGVIPEALPLVMTFSFSKGAASLAKHQVIVKRLSAVEDLGNVEILCCDKTGTLTENKMEVTGRFASVKGGEEELLLYSLLASDPSEDRTDPFDKAIAHASGAGGYDWLKNYKILFDSPFDPQFMRNNVLVEKDDKALFLVRGAFELIKDMCSQGDLTGAENWAKEQGKLGRRILAVASKPINQLNLDSFQANFREEENGLELKGLISFSDPVKASTISAILKAKKWGVDLKIITGDSKEVAGAVGMEVGLCGNLDEVISAAEFIALSEPEKKAALKRYHIFARVGPEQKYDIIERLQKDYNVGYLGDGINDAPALKIAGVSLAVNNASDIARETADIILLEKDLNIIINGIHEGRIIFANSIKYIKATLASNFGNFYAVAVASLFIDYLPMLPLQILLLNLVTDFPMIAIAGDNVDDEELILPRRYEVKDIIIVTTVLGIISTIFDFVFFIIFSRISPAVLQTNWFIASTITELLFIFSIRSRRFFLFSRKPSIGVLLFTIPAALVAFIIPFTQFGHKFFNFTSPKPQYLLWIVGIALLYFAATEIFKILYYSKPKSSESGPVLSNE